jgi:Flp pilus assembly pilin Flp
VKSRHRPNFTQEGDSPDDVKGGELVLKLFTSMQAFAASVLRRDDGQTMAEYSVVLAVITLAIITGIAFLSGQIQSAYEAVAAIF